MSQEGGIVNLEQSSGQNAYGLKNHVSPVRSRPSAQTKSLANSRARLTEGASQEASNHVSRTAGRAKQGRPIRAVVDETSRDTHYRARAAVRRAVARRDILRPKSRSDCGRERPVFAHHAQGYAVEHWLKIAWLCRECHADTHFPARVAERGRIGVAWLDPVLDRRLS